MLSNQDYGQNESGIYNFKNNKERNNDDLQINQAKEQDSGTLRNNYNKIESSLEQHQDIMKESLINEIVSLINQNSQQKKSESDIQQFIMGDPKNQD